MVNGVRPSLILTVAPQMNRLNLTAWHNSRYVILKNVFRQGAPPHTHTYIPPPPTPHSDQYKWYSPAGKKDNISCQSVLLAMLSINSARSPSLSL